MMTAQVCIGRTVVMHPGVFLGHGQVVVDGFAEIHSGAVIQSWVTIGLRGGSYQGPTIGRDVRIGTGAKVLGAVTVHDGAASARTRSWSTTCRRSNCRSECRPGSWAVSTPPERQCARRQNAPSQSIASIGSSMPWASR